MMPTIFSNSSNQGVVSPSDVASKFNGSVRPLLSSEPALVVMVYRRAFQRRHREDKGKCNQIPSNYIHPKQQHKSSDWFDTAGAGFGQRLPAGTELNLRRARSLPPRIPVNATHPRNHDNEQAHETMGHETSDPCVPGRSERGSKYKNTLETYTRHS